MSSLTRPDGTPIRIVAVDDEPSLIELLAMAMRYEGWEVHTASTGTDGVRLAREVQPDALVLDIMLPDFDGLEVMRRIRTEQPDVPVIFLTAKDGVSDRIAGLTAGGAGCCAGPAPPPLAQRRNWWWATSSSTRTPTR